MKLVRYPSPEVAWSSFDRLSPLRDLLDPAFALASAAPERERPRGWTPALDVYEDSESITARLEVAGVKKDAFDISLHGNTLTISGERKYEVENDGGESFRSERVFGRFSRTIQLPTPVKTDAVAADYSDGVLSVVLPKADEAKPKRIAVEIK